MTTGSDLTRTLVVEGRRRHRSEDDWDSNEERRKRRELGRKGVCVCKMSVEWGSRSRERERERETHTRQEVKKRRRRKEEEFEQVGEVNKKSSQQQRHRQLVSMPTSTKRDHKQTGDDVYVCICVCDGRTAANTTASWKTEEDEEEQMFQDSATDFRLLFLRPFLVSVQNNSGSALQSIDQSIYPSWSSSSFSFASFRISRLFFITTCSSCSSSTFVCKFWLWSIGAQSDQISFLISKSINLIDQPDSKSANTQPFEWWRVRWDQLKIGCCCCHTSVELAQFRWSDWQTTTAVSVPF